MTSTANFKIGEAIVEKTVSNENENSITMAICKKLLATNMVANNFLGLCNNSFIAEAFGGFFSDKSEISFEVNEKSATSDAAIIAQQKSNTTIPILPNNILGSIFETK